MSNPIVSLEGTGVKLSVYEDRVVISASGKVGKVLSGGEKTIYINQISSMQYKGAGLLPGSLQVIVPGAVSSDNLIVFPKQQNAQAEAVKAKIEELLAKAQAGRSQPSTSDADVLAKFKALLDSGAITQDEYDAKKKQLLGI